MSSLKKTLFRLISFFLLPLIFPYQASAQSGIEPATIGRLNIIFSNLVNALIGLVGMASLVMLIVGGFYYISAGSDKDAAQKAQHTISFALGGFIVSVSAWLLLSLLGSFFGVNVSFFNICASVNCD